MATGTIQVELLVDLRVEYDISEADPSVGLLVDAPEDIVVNEVVIEGTVFRRVGCQSDRLSEFVDSVAPEFLDC